MQGLTARDADSGARVCARFTFDLRGCANEFHFHKRPIATESKMRVILKLNT